MLSRFLFLATLHTTLTAFATPECTIGDSKCRANAIKKHEADLQIQYPGKIQRIGDTLNIRSASGKTITFKDNRSDNDNFVIHNAWSVLPNVNWVVVYAGYYEWSGHFLVSLYSGQVIKLEGYEEPVLSPDSKHLIAYSQDLDAAFNANFISIYKIDKNRAKLEIALSGDKNTLPKNNENHDTEFWGPSNPRWINNDTVHYSENRLKNGAIQSTLIQLKLINGKWEKSITDKSPAVNIN